MGIATSKPSALPMSVLSIFEMQLINGALFLKSHKSDLSTDLLNLICLLGFYLSSALPDWS